MKVKTIVKIILDVVMTALFIPLLFPNQTGFAFHEIFGITLALLSVAHLFLNGKWLIASTKQLIARKATNKLIFLFTLDSFLFIGMAITTCTGIFTSTVLFPFFSFQPAIAAAHRISAYITAVTLSVHVAMHLKYLAAMFKKIAQSITLPAVRRTLGSALAIVMTVGIIYYNVVASAEKQIAIPATADPSVELSQAPIPDYGSLSSSSIATPAPPIFENETNDELTAPLPEQSEEISPILPSPDPTPIPISLSEYLSKLHCSICARNCLLSAPRCGRSENLIAEATAEYHEIYGA